MFDTLYKKYDKLQKKYGDKNLHSIYHGGCFHHPQICFIFMNPTGRNTASMKEWNGIRAPWIGTKNVWKVFFELGLLKESTYQAILDKKPLEWTEEFAFSLYQEISEKGYFITNLGKCTQIDARPLPNSIYLEYLDLLKEEIALVKPEIIITFGNQVSSILLNQKVSVSEWRGKYEYLEIKGKKYKVYPVYYPVGNGQFNMPKAIEDIQKIIKENRLF